MKVNVIMECNAQGNYSCYTEEEFEGFALLGYGNTPEKAKADFLSAYEEIKADLVASGNKVPNLTFTYKYDLNSLFSYFSVLNVSELARKCGINESQLRQYRSGISKASEQQYEKIRKTIHAIGIELASAEI